MLCSSLCRYPPSADRKYMLVFWDHGSGWSGYGVDHTCTSTATYSQNWGCDILSIQKITQGMLCSAAGIRSCSCSSSCQNERSTGDQPLCLLHKCLYGNSDVWISSADCPSAAGRLARQSQKQRVTRLLFSCRSTSRSEGLHRCPSQA